MGYTLAELEQAGFIDWIHPEDRERMRTASWDGLYRGQSYREVEYLLVAKDGTLKWASATWGPIFEAGRQVGVQGRERDITKRKTAEEILRESEQRFRGLLENAQLSALMVDLDGRMTYCNDYIVAATGWAREEMVEHPIVDFLVEKSVRRVTRYDQGGAPGPPLRRNGLASPVSWLRTAKSAASAPAPWSCAIPGQAHRPGQYWLRHH